MDIDSADDQYFDALEESRSDLGSVRGTESVEFASLLHWLASLGPYGLCDLELEIREHLKAFDRDEAIPCALHAEDGPGEVPENASNRLSDGDGGYISKPLAAILRMCTEHDQTAIGYTRKRIRETRNRSAHAFHVYSFLPAVKSLAVLVLAHNIPVVSGFSVSTQPASQVLLSTKLILATNAVAIIPIVLGMSRYYLRPFIQSILAGLAPALCWLLLCQDSRIEALNMLCCFAAWTATVSDENQRRDGRHWKRGRYVILGVFVVGHGLWALLVDRKGSEQDGAKNLGSLVATVFVWAM